jgi:hypothetical protein
MFWNPDSPTLVERSQNGSPDPGEDNMSELHPSTLRTLLW